MEGRGEVWAILLLATAAVAVGNTIKQGYTDPCEHHACPAGDECVSHEVRCEQQTCPRIMECRAANCTLPCLDGYECARRPQPCARPPCPTEEECVPMPDACRGRCLPDELCLTSVKVTPCERPPCAESVCVPRGTALTARHQPPPPSFCGDCQAPAVCVPTQVCRQQNECLFLPVCLTNCTAMWCGQGHECQMRASPQCQGDNCTLEPTCVPEEAALEVSDTGAARPDVPLEDRFGSSPRQPQCVVECTADEECRFMPTRCVNPPCATVSRCVPRSRPPLVAAPPPGGVCPLDDLRHLASPAFCGTASLHQCEADSECGPQKRCCDRGCGRSCLPTCRPGCGLGKECRLVKVQCAGSPCPKVPQCVASEVFDALPGASSASRPAPSFEHASRPALDSSASSGSSSSSPFPKRPPITRTRPGLCPVNDHQTRSRICFDNGSVDLCANDGTCPVGTRCCSAGCQLVCRPTCDSCPRGLQCRLRAGRPACLKPLPERPRLRAGARQGHQQQRSSGRRA